MAGLSENCCLLDGIVCLYEDFDYLDNSFIWTLPRHITIEKREPKDFKGVKLLQDVQIAEVQIGTWYKMPMYICITFSEKGQPIKYAEVRKIIASGVDFAISWLGFNSRTYSNWYSRCCVQYEDWINGKVCDICKSSERVHLSIFPDDVRTFGQHFSQYLQFWFSELNYNFYTEIHQFGQNLNWEKAVDILENLNVVNIMELVVHVAKDYWQNGKILLWNQKAVRELIPGLMEKYYNGFTGSHGNFTIHCRNNVDTEIQKVKFYSSLFKEMHRGKVFKQTCVASVFLDYKQRSRCKVDLNGIDRMVNAVHQNNTITAQKRCNCARVEAIISLKNLGFEEMRPMLEECKILFDNEFGQAYRLFSAFDFSTFEEQVNSTLIPALTTLTNIVRTERRLRDENPMHYVHLYTLHQAMACEMLISYFIYGKLDVWEGAGKRFNARMQNALSLNQSTFKFAETFQGLRFTNLISLRQGELHYNGKFFVTEYVDINDEENRGRISNCFEILSNNGNSPARLKSVYEVIAEIFWEEIIAYAEKTRYRTTFGIASVDYINSFIDTKPHVAISSSSFVSKMFNTESNIQKLFQHVYQAVGHIVGTCDTLQEEVQRKIEMELWKSGKSLLYPSVNDGTFVVLPSCGEGTMTFSTASDDIKLDVAGQYLRSYRKLYGSRIVIPEILEILSAAEGYKCESDMVNIIFNKMSMVGFLSRS